MSILNFTYGKTFIEVTSKQEVGQRGQGQLMPKLKSSQIFLHKVEISMIKFQIQEPGQLSQSLSQPKPKLKYAHNMLQIMIYSLL